MSDNLDDFLSSLGVTSQEEPRPQSLSSQDFDDILGDFGFSTAQDEEEVHDGSDDEGVEEEEEYNDNISEGRDLDAEEDANWQEAVGSEDIVPIEFDPALVANQDVPTVTEEQRQHLRELEQAAIEAHQAVVEASSQSEPLLPPNSPTLLMDTATSRFSGTEWYHKIQEQRVIIAGIGGIGSNAVFQLARMCPASMVMYDDDTVETVNMSGQLFSVEDVGKSKVDAMVDMITKYTSMRNIYANRQKFDADCEAGDIMICGFDNMSARKTFFQAWIAHIENKNTEERKRCLFLDGRLSIDTLQVFCMTGDDQFNQRRYINDFLFSDAQADATVCSMKQTTYLACMIGSVMVNLFTNFTANILEPIIPYDLPFFTEYDAQNMIFKTEK